MVMVNDYGRTAAVAVMMNVNHRRAGIAIMMDNHDGWGSVRRAIINASRAASRNKKTKRGQSRNAAAGTGGDE